MLTFVLTELRAGVGSLSRKLKKYGFGVKQKARKYIEIKTKKEEKETIAPAPKKQNIIKKLYTTLKPKRKGPELGTIYTTKKQKIIKLTKRLRNYGRYLKEKTKEYIKTKTKRKKKEKLTEAPKLERKPTDVRKQRLQPTKPIMLTALIHKLRKKINQIKLLYVE